MTTNDLAYALVAVLDDVTLEDGESNDVDVERARTFDDAGLLTSADGLVLTLADGSVFQLTIARAS